MWFQWPRESLAQRVSSALLASSVPVASGPASLLRLETSGLLPQVGSSLRASQLRWLHPQRHLEWSLGPHQALVPQLPVSQPVLWLPEPPRQAAQPLGALWLEPAESWSRVPLRSWAGCKL